MVLFFIAYLIIIIIFCFPFNIKMAFFVDNKGKDKDFFFKVGFFTIPIKKISLKKRKKRKSKFGIKLKGFHLKKLIEYRVLLEINLPERLNAIIEELKFNFSPLRYVLRLFPQLDINCNSSFNKQNSIYFQAKFSLKTNTFLIFSSILQTLTIGSKQKWK